jgi:chemotaxis protein MotB
VSKSRRHKTKNSKLGAPLWMVTYGDMVTLLLTFFVMLFSFSTIDAQKWQALVESLQGGNIGVLEDGNTLEQLPNNDNEISQDELNKLIERKKNDKQENPRELDGFVKLYQEIEQYMKQNQIPAEVELSKTHTEILIRFKDYILFDSGKSEIKPKAKEILDKIASVLLIHNNEIDRIRVEGHTDTQPINTQLFPTNWELSGDRAIKVVRYFEEQHNFPGNKLSGEGYGEYYPIASNDTKEGMARNRRVDIQIVKTIEMVTE